MKRILFIIFTLAFFNSFSQSTTIVISQFYGSGGNAGAPYNADYVELHNISNVDQSLSGKSIQYAAATNAGLWTGVAALPAATIPAGGYYLIQMSTTGAVGVALPTPDHLANPPISMSGTNGRVALVNGITALTGCPTTPELIDLAGYGTSVCFETTATPALTTATAGFRNNNGCTDTNNNSTDFTMAAPAPRNSASPTVNCSGGSNNPAITAGSVNNFGNVLVLTNSASQTFNISGSNLTGAPGNITITSPSTDFQVSSDNGTWGATTSIAYTAATLAATPVYVRFTPQSAGLKTGNVTISGGGVATPVNVAVAGNGITTLPTAGNLVISQLYGAGGNSGSLFNADYVEIHNRSNVDQSTAGYSIQYASATSTGTWSGKALLPTATIPSGGYYLIQMSAVGTIGTALPTPDYLASPTIAMSASNGRVALVTDTFTLSACPTTPNISDLVGYGTSVCSETTAIGALDTLHAGFRNNNGCDDTNNNLADFSLNTPSPRNTASPVSICSTATTPLIVVNGSLSDFGNVVVATSSASQSFVIAGSNLTGAPGNITISAPSGNFQVSLDNTNWSSAVTVPYSGTTLSSTTIYVHFTPQTVGVQSGNIIINGGGIATAVTVAVSGTGVAVATPAISTTALTGFGNVCLNATAGPNNFTITGSNLSSADITVGPLAGFAFATASGGPYTASVNITHAPGALSQVVYVQFAPTALQSYNGNIPVAGGGIANTVNVVVTGSGTNSAPGVTTGSASAISPTGATLAGSIPSTGCSAISAYGFEYSTTNGFANGTGIQVSSSNLTASSFSAFLNGLTPSTTYYFKAFATNSGGTTYGLQVSFTTAAPPPATVSASALNAFGEICVNSTTDQQSFDLTCANLTAADLTVGPLNGFAFSTSAAGPYAASLTIAHAPGTLTQTIFVNFTPTAVAIYDGNIPVAGGGLVNAVGVLVSASGIISTPDVVTADSTNILANSAILHGAITDPGCTDVTEYGIEYSGINGFTNGFGTKVPASNLSGGVFSSNLTGLVQNTAYFYKAYAKNNGGITYGEQKLFITAAIPAGLTIYSNPVIRGTDLHYSLSGIKPGHYAVRIHNAMGQLVYKKEMLLQLNFIDDKLVIPSHLPIGLYNFQISNISFKIQKQIFIQ